MAHSTGCEDPNASPHVHVANLDPTPPNTHTHRSTPPLTLFTSVSLGALHSHSFVGPQDRAEGLVLECITEWLVNEAEGRAKVQSPPGRLLPS